YAVLDSRVNADCIAENFLQGLFFFTCHLVSLAGCGGSPRVLSGDGCFYCHRRSPCLMFLPFGAASKEALELRPRRGAAGGPAWSRATGRAGIGGRAVPQPQARRRGRRRRVARWRA